MDIYDVIVIGGGHAGIEASLASSRMGCQTLMLSLSTDTIGHTSCNPAIGGVGKSQLVKEIDALGGEMAKAADACGIQFRTLNSSKGPAVQSLRCQIDRNLYRDYMRNIVLNQDRLFVRQAEVSSLIVEDNQVKGVVTAQKEEILSHCLIICPGTFLAGLIHLGLRHYLGGRMGEPASTDLSNNLKELGFRLLRFKTGTCPRLDKKTIDFSNLIIQESDNPCKPFSFSTASIKQRQLPCYITYTNKNTHCIIQENLDKSPLYTGIIKATGVRYCPSVEDKVVKFSDKQRHPVFLEPEGYDTDQVYPNGLSTSLPEEAQLKIIHSIAGLEDARIIFFGYGIEHSVVEPTQLYSTLETKLIKNLYFAGQINGTTGYEEAAAQGLVSGVNAALRIQKKEPLILDRALCYIGVLIDDLTTKGTNEPYRMFTSRVEYRLLLRQDNADLRLTALGNELGLVNKDTCLKVKKKEEEIKKGISFLRSSFLKPTPALNRELENLHTAPLKRKTSLEELLKRPRIHLKQIRALTTTEIGFAEFISEDLEIEVKYKDFIQRQYVEVERFRNLEKIKIPQDLDFNQIKSLSREIKEKLSRFRPMNLGQATRIWGVTPAAISILMVYLKKLNVGQHKNHPPTR